jgi:protein-L-isoaspartate(D-aspartate) O-methyltransferase
MVEMHLVARGISDPAVLDAFLQVPREDFVRPADQDAAYDDVPLPLGAPFETISQPYVVAWMAELARLTPGCRLLEIGTGSGYAAAIFAAAGARVWSIERNAVLAERARERLAPYEVQVRVGDGWEGWPDAAPFDVIISSVGTGAIPGAWHAQLAPGGRLVAPVGEARQQVLETWEAGVRTARGAVSFVTLRRGIVSPPP